MKRLICVLSVLLAGTASANNYVGDYAPAASVRCSFGTVQPSTGASYALAGTPVVSVYKDGGTTESTSGVTLTASLDSLAGLNHVVIDTSSNGTFYSAGSYFDVVITTGTVDGVSVVGQPVCAFTLNKVSALRPATAGRTVVVDSAGLVDANTVKLGPTGSGTAQTARDIGASVLISSGTGSGQLSVTSGVIASNVTQFGGSAGSFSSGRPSVNVNSLANDSITAAVIQDGAIDNATFACTGGSFLILGVTDCGTAQSASSTGAVLRSAAAFADDVPIGSTLLIQGSTQGYPQSRAVTDYTGSSDTAAVDTWSVTPSGTLTYYLFGTAPGSAASGDIPTPEEIADEVATRTLNANVTQFGGTNGTFSSGRPEVNTTRIGGQTASASGTVTFPNATLASTTNITAGTITTATNVTNAPTSGDFTATMKTSIGTAVAASAVASVTGNVGGTVNGLTSTAQGHVRTALGMSTANLDTQLSTIDGVADAIKTTTDKLDDTLELDSTVYRFTANALEQAPTGSGEAADTIGEAVATKLFTYDTGQTSGDAVSGSVVAEIGNLAAGGGIDPQDIADIKAKTDNLPPDPADASDVAAAISALPSAAQVVTAIEASTALPIAKYTNANGDVCTFIISENEPHLSVSCTEAP